MREPKADELTGLYTRIPVTLATHLDDLSVASSRAKQQIVTEIFQRALTPESHPRAGAIDALTLEEVTELLRVDAREVRSSIDGNTLPGRRVGAAWRFSRAALDSWLTQPEPHTDRAVGFSVPSTPASPSRSRASK